MRAKGHKASEEQKRKQSIAMKGRPSNWKGKHPTEETRKRMSASALKRYEDKKNHPRWKGGVSRDIHGGKENIEWRSRVFERDNWTCQTCHIRGVYLEAHHIKSWKDYPELRFNLENGVTLCKECHSLTDNYKGKANRKV